MHQIIVIAVLLGILTFLLTRKKRQRREWREEVVVITGGSGNLGTALRTRLDALGATVYTLDIRDGGHEGFIHCDVTSGVSVEKALKVIDRQVTILINNCGVYSGKQFLDLTEDAFTRTMQVNFVSYVHMTRAVLKRMARDKENWIVSISSCLGLLGVPRMTDYCASKFAVNGFMEALRMELKWNGTKTRTMTVCPFLVKGGMFQNVNIRFPLITRPLDPDEIAMAIINGIERGREEIWLPWALNLLPIARLLPTWLLDTCQFILGTPVSLS